MDAHVGDTRWAARAQGNLDPLAVPCPGEGGGGVVALGDVGFQLEEKPGEVFLGTSIVVGGEVGRMEGGRVQAAVGRHVNWSSSEFCLLGLHI